MWKHVGIWSFLLTSSLIATIIGAIYLPSKGCEYFLRKECIKPQEFTVTGYQNSSLIDVYGTRTFIGSVVLDHSRVMVIEHSPVYLIEELELIFSHEYPLGKLVTLWCHSDNSICCWDDQLSCDGLNMLACLIPLWCCLLMLGVHHLCSPLKPVLEFLTLRTATSSSIPLPSVSVTEQLPAPPMAQT